MDFTNLYILYILLFHNEVFLKRIIILLNYSKLHLELEDYI
jgi:hypothetical protein